MRRGFTLVEIMVAASLMSIIFVFGWAISNSFLGIRKVRNYEVAVSIAYQALDAIRAARFRELGADRDGRKDTLLADFQNPNNMFDGEKGEGFIPVVTVRDVEFKRQVFISDCPSNIDGVASGLKLIRILITWKAPEDGSAMTFEVVTTQADQL